MKNWPFAQSQTGIQRLNPYSLQVTLEKKNGRSLEEQVLKLKQSLEISETKLADKEREFEAFKSLHKTQPEVKLQQEVHILTLEKHELEKKVDAGKEAEIWGTSASGFAT